MGRSQGGRTAGVSGQSNNLNQMIIGQTGSDYSESFAFNRQVSVIDETV